MTPAFTPSLHQSNFFSEIQDGTTSILVEAVAGSGKTTTIVHSCQLIPNYVLTIFLAFNKRIAEELESRLPSHVQCGTFHSRGFRALQRHLPKRPKVDKDKVRSIIKSNLKYQDYELYGQYAQKLVGLAKSAGLGTELMEDNERSWNSLIAHFCLTLDSGDADPERALDIARSTFRTSNDIKDVVDFDDMLYLALRLNVTFDKANFVFVDEAQDTNGVQRALLKRMLSSNTVTVTNSQGQPKEQQGRLVAVGDPHQCQPAGTLVTIVGKTGNRWHKATVKQIPIEEIKPQDRVVSYSLEEHSFIMAGLSVLNIYKRPFCGELVTVTTMDGRSSAYTPEHRCLVNFSPLRELYALYIMKRGNNYRVGKCKMDYGSNIGSGPIARLRQERGDAIWVLDTYSTNEEVVQAEQFVSGQFGIPQLLFVSTNVSVMSQEMLDSTWLTIGENVNKAIRALEFYRRLIQYPLYNKQFGATYMSLKRPMIVEACNLLQGCAVLPFTGDAHSSKQVWQQVWVDHKFYEGFVYSLQVAQTELYIADGLVTHNSIYGFRGADATAMDLLAEEFSAKRLPLSICYRCSQAVVREAQKHLSQR